MLSDIIQSDALTNTQRYHSDALVELLHNWYEATDKLDTFVRIISLDFSKAFDLINHEMLIDKLALYDMPSHILRWMAHFLTDRSQKVKIRKMLSWSGMPNGRVPQGTLVGPIIMFLSLHKI